MSAGGSQEELTGFALITHLRSQAPQECWGCDRVEEPVEEAYGRVRSGEQTVADAATYVAAETVSLGGLCHGLRNRSYSGIPGIFHEGSTADCGFGRES